MAIYQGILLRIEGKQTRVLFETDGDPVEYYLPTKILKKAGVYIENQPFEIEDRAVRALAPASSAKIEKLDLGPEYGAKLQYILSHLK